jgi:hypothetical protein
MPAGGEPGRSRPRRSLASSDSLRFRRTPAFVWRGWLLPTHPGDRLEQLAAAVQRMSSYWKISAAQPHDRELLTMVRIAEAKGVPVFDISPAHRPIQHLGYVTSA